MKKTIFILAILFSVSCGKELDINPASSVDAAQAKKSVDLLITGAYALIGSGPGTKGANEEEGGLYSTDLLLNADLLASENYLDFVGTFDQYKEVSNKLMSARNISISRMWEKGYAAINLANTVLRILPTVPETDRDYYQAQALFIRAIVHFELLRFWMEPSTGLGIPVLTEPTENFDEIKHPARATIAESYNSIIADLELSKSMIGIDNDVFANQYTVTAFLARIYLQMGAYELALAAADEIIKSDKYRLAESVEDAFNTSFHQEIIFEIQQNEQNNAGTTNDGLTTFYSCDTETPGGASRGDLNINSNFLDKFDDPQDKRLTILIYDGDCASVKTSGKWRDPYASIPVIRLSEMYLIRAEANTRLTSEVGDSPVNDLNELRRKAGAAEYTTVTINDVLLERELELAFEGHRIHDFKRTNKQIVVDGEMIDYTDAQFILPIPQSQINTNTNVLQNTYYK